MLLMGSEDPAPRTIHTCVRFSYPAEEGRSSSCTAAVAKEAVRPSYSVEERRDALNCWHSHPTPLVSVRDSVLIVPVEIGHASAIQELVSHPKVAETTNIPQPYPKNGAVSWIVSATPRQMAGFEYAFAIVRRQDQQVVGVTSLMNVGNGEAELGYWVGVPFWGNGYATSANRRILEVAFDRIGLDRLFARPLERNIASCRVLEKVGFRHTDTVDNVFPKWEDADRLAIYEMLASEWKTVPTADRKPHSQDRSRKSRVQVRR